ncbi:hypothetical protein H4R33_006112 [Dimargaris cristalligena]|nr:hypothetical protein H4R33_006112 [Dimargaris cristalligena]
MKPLSTIASAVKVFLALQSLLIALGTAQPTPSKQGLVAKLPFELHTRLTKHLSTHTLTQFAQVCSWLNLAAKNGRFNYRNTVSGKIKTVMGMPGQTRSLEQGSETFTPAQRVKVFLDLMRPLELSAYYALAISTVTSHRSPANSLAFQDPTIRDLLTQAAADWQYLEYRTLNPSQKEVLNPFLGLANRGEWEDLASVLNALFKLSPEYHNTMNLQSRLSTWQRAILSGDSVATLIPDFQLWGAVRTLFMVSSVAFLVYDHHGARLSQFLLARLEQDYMVEHIALLATIFLLESDQFQLAEDLLDQFSERFDEEAQAIYFQCLEHFGHFGALATFYEVWQVEPDFATELDQCYSMLYDSRVIAVSEGGVALRLLRSTVPKPLQHEQFWLAKTEPFEEVQQSFAWPI